MSTGKQIAQAVKTGKKIYDKATKAVKDHPIPASVGAGYAGNAAYDATKKNKDKQK